jgi:hypothetical protein
VTTCCAANPALRCPNIAAAKERRRETPVSAEDDLIHELVRVRRGWGLQDRNLINRIGPALTLICGIWQTDNDRQIHRRVRSWLIAHITELPPELARAALVAFALDRTGSTGSFRSGSRIWRPSSRARRGRCAAGSTMRPG